MAIKLLCNHLMMTVEYLFLNFRINVHNFKYFTDNCKAKLKKLYIIFDNYKKKEKMKKYYLVCANNFQKVHTSLKLFGIKGHYERMVNLTDKEIEIINLLKNQGINILLHNKLDLSVFHF
jgi:hypothetical protein